MGVSKGREQAFPCRYLFPRGPISPLHPSAKTNYIPRMLCQCQPFLPAAALQSFITKWVSKGRQDRTNVGVEQEVHNTEAGCRMRMSRIVEPKRRDSDKWGYRSRLTARAWVHHRHQIIIIRSKPNCCVLKTSRWVDVCRQDVVENGFIGLAEWRFRKLNP